MSIVGAAANADPGGSALGLALALFAGFAAVAVAALTGVLRLPGAAGAPRVPAGRPLAPLVGVLFAGVVIWVLVPTLYLQVTRGAGKAGVDPQVVPPPTPVGPTSNPGGLSFREVVTINAVVPVLALAVLVLGDAATRQRVGHRLGFDLERLPRGALWGGVGIFMALPLVYCVMVFTALAYRLSGYEPPAEHELLRTMGQTPDRFVKYLAIVVAVVVAPLWEELLFRGHVQTLIREGLARLRHGGRAGAEVAFRVVGEAGLADRAFQVVGVHHDEPPPLAELAAGRGFPLESWAAILVASLLFAGVHQPWQFPPIFGLSLCLGIAYERTGNLWVPVVMHALFNGTMTAFYLARGAGGAN